MVAGRDVARHKAVCAACEAASPSPRHRTAPVAVRRDFVALSADGVAAEGSVFESSTNDGFAVDGSTTGGNAGEP